MKPMLSNRTMLCSLLILCLTSKGFGQGRIVLENKIGTLLDAPVFDTDCVTRLEGEAYSAQGYAGLNPLELTPLGQVGHFRTGIGAGYLDGLPAFGVPGSIPGDQVYAQLRVWETAAGSSYEAAMQSGGKYGFSNIIPLYSASWTSPPEPPLALKSFCLIPEPPVWVLGSVGAAFALFLARRRPKPRRVAQSAGERERVVVR